MQNSWDQIARGVVRAGLKQALISMDNDIDRNINGAGAEYYKLQDMQNKIDAVTGSGVGGLIGAPAGYYVGSLFDKGNSSIKQKVMNRLVGAGTGLTTGALIGASTGIAAGRTDLVNSLYTKLAMRFKNSEPLAARDMLGRITALNHSRKESWDDRIDRAEHMFQGLIDHDKLVEKYIINHVNK